MDAGTIPSTLAARIKIAITTLVPLALYLAFHGTLDDNIVTFLVLTSIGILLLAFDFFDSGMIGLLIPISYLIFGVAPQNVIFHPWVTDLLWLILGAHLLAVSLDRSGLLKRFAFGCIRLCKGSFTRFLYILLVVLLIEAVVTFANAYMINCAIYWSICKAFKYWKVKQSAILMIIMEMAGGMACVINFFPLYNSMITNGFQTVYPGWTWNWIDQIVMFWPGYVFMFVLVFVISKIFKTDKIQIIEGGLEYFDEEYKKLGPITRREIYALLILLSILLYVGLTPVHGWNMLYAFTLLPLLFFMPGVRLADSQSFKEININMYLIIAAFAGMGFVASHIGLSQIIADKVTPFLQSQSSPTISALSITVLGTLSNLVLTPGGILASLSSTVAAICQNVGLDPLVGAFSLMYSLDLIFMPYQDMGVMTKYSSGHAKLSDYMQMCVIRFVVFFGGYVFIMLPYWKLLGKL